MSDDGVERLGVKRRRKAGVIDKVKSIFDVEQPIMTTTGKMLMMVGLQDRT